MGVEDKELGAGSSRNSSHSHRSRNGVLSKRGTSVGASIVVQTKQSRQNIKKKASSRSVLSGSNSNRAGQKHELNSPMDKTEQLMVSSDSETNPVDNESMHGMINSMNKTPEIYISELA